MVVNRFLESGASLHRKPRFQEPILPPPMDEERRKPVLGVWGVTTCSVRTPRSPRTGLAQEPVYDLVFTNMEEGGRKPVLGVWGVTTYNAIIGPSAEDRARSCRGQSKVLQRAEQGPAEDRPRSW